MEPTAVFEEYVAEFAKALMQLNPNECRRYYDQRVEECESTLIVMHACDINETAGDDSSKGGYYSYSLIKSTRRGIREFWWYCGLTFALERLLGTLLRSFLFHLRVKLFFVNDISLVFSL